MKFDVEQNLTAIWWVGEYEKIRLNAHMGWRKDDPAVVHMILTHERPGLPDAPWLLGRSILVNACIFGTKSGTGDVVAEPAHEEDFGGAVVLLHLTNEEDHMHLLLSRNSLYRFLGETLAHMSLDAESAHYEGVIASELKEMLA